MIIDEQERPVAKFNSEGSIKDSVFLRLFSMYHFANDFFYWEEQMCKRYGRDQADTHIRISRAFYLVVRFNNILTKHCKQNGRGSTHRGYPTFSG